MITCKLQCPASDMRMSTSDLSAPRECEMEKTNVNVLSEVRSTCSQDARKRAQDSARPQAPKADWRALANFSRYKTPVSSWTSRLSSLQCGGMISICFPKLLVHLHSPWCHTASIVPQTENIAYQSPAASDFAQSVGPGGVLEIEHTFTLKSRFDLTCAYEDSEKRV